MKKIVLVFALSLCLLLSACGEMKRPERTAEGTPWSADWTTLGRSMGVEAMEGWELQRSEDVLAAEGMFYNVWVCGDAVTYLNGEGTEVTSYPGEIHLVVTEKESTEEAQQSVEDWAALTQERYPDSTAAAQSYAGQTYTVSIHPGGASATAVRGYSAILVDVALLEGSDLDGAQVLAEFLNHCHYAE